MESDNKLSERLMKCMQPIEHRLIFSLSLSRSWSRMPMVFTLLCLCVLKMGSFSASVTQATVQSGESRV